MSMTTAPGMLTGAAVLLAANLLLLAGAAAQARQDAGDASAQTVTPTGGLSARLDALLSGTAALSGQAIGPGPLFPTCPVGNCPAGAAGYGGAYGGPTLSKQWVYGTSTPAHQAQFLSSIGLYVGDGNDSAGRGQYAAQYVGAMQGPGGGATWALNTDVVRGACPGGPDSLYGQPGSGIPFGQDGCAALPGSLSRQNGTIGYELDLSNLDQDAPPGGAFVVGMFLSTLSSYSSLAGLFYGAGAGQTVPSWHDGIFFGGKSNGGSADTVSDNTVFDASGGAFGYHAAGVHERAAFWDESTGQHAILLTGTKSVADIHSMSASPAAMSIEGQHAVAGIYDASTGPAALKVDGTHQSAALALGGSAPAAVAASGAFPRAAFTSLAATTPIALQAAAGQQVCWAGVHACISYSAAVRKFVFTDGAGAVIASLSDGGDLVLRGTLKQSSTP